MVLLRPFSEISFVKTKFHQIWVELLWVFEEKRGASIRTNQLFLPAVALYGLFSAYRVPCFIRLCFERPHVGINLHFEFSFEITWCSPRVPAGAASAIVEFVGGKNFAGLVYNVKGRRGLPLTVLLDSAGVFFSGLTLDNKTDGNVTAAYLDIGLNQKGRPGFGAAVLEAGK
jgi:hypothetical protein